MISSDDQKRIPQPSAALSISRHRPPTIVLSSDPLAASNGAAGAISVDTYFHALRRTWFWCLLLGLLAGGIAAGTTYMLAKDQYTATAVLQAYANPQRLVPTKDKDPEVALETYLSNVKQFLKSQFTIVNALKPQEIANLSLVQAEEDPVSWLADKLEVNNPKSSEVLFVSLTLPDPVQAEKLVNAVVNSYWNEVEDADEQNRELKLQQLTKARDEQLMQETSKRALLKGLVEKFGGADGQALSLQQQIELQKGSLVGSELVRTRLRQLQAETDLRLANEGLAGLKDVQPSEEELKVLAFEDMSARVLIEELGWLEQNLRQAMSLTTKSSNMATGHVQTQKRDLEERLNQLQERLVMQWRVKQRRELEETIAQKSGEVQALNRLVEELDGEEKLFSERARALGKQSIEVEMKRKEIERLEGVVDSIAREIELTRVEAAAESRLQEPRPARVPVSANAPGRKVLAGLAGMLAFVLPGIGIMFLDLRAHRVNTPGDIPQRLGLPVFGSVPILPSHVTRRLGSTSSRGRRWQAVLSEAISAIRANLIKLGNVKVVMVTSAIGGEGKTTVATQLAMSLARIGKKTALVDFDLPRPAVNTVFDVPLEPGISDVLRGECILADVVNEAALPNLFVITAGVADAVGSQALNSGRLEEVVDQLRDEFDYVIVDSSPLVLVADSRVISRCVDGALCCVLRDVSRLPLVRQASDILTTFDVRLLGTVVTAKQDTYYLSPYYNTPLTDRETTSATK